MIVKNNYLCRMFSRYMIQQSAYDSINDISYTTATICNHRRAINIQVIVSVFTKNPKFVVWLGNLNIPSENLPSLINKCLKRLVAVYHSDNNYNAYLQPVPSTIDTKEKAKVTLLRFLNMYKEPYISNLSKTF